MALNEPICVVNSSEEQFLSSNSKTKPWEDLEQYWNTENYDVKSLKNIACSITYNEDKHKIYEENTNNFLNIKSKGSLEDKVPSQVVHGSDVKDIPTTYEVANFMSHEKVVIGTYIDENIIPGFQYKVRKVLEGYLFDGQAQTLESIGLGYGKRLTFSGNNLNSNKNYFWSDSHKHGFGLTLQCITPNSVFRITDKKNSTDIGKIIVNNPSWTEDVELTTHVQDGGSIQKTVKVHFSGDVVLGITSNRQKAFYEDVEVKGTAMVQRHNNLTKASIQEIILESFIVENCSLVPEE